MYSELVENLHKLTGLPQEQVAKQITRPKDLSHGDLAFPCFLLAKELNKAPPQCAAELAQTITLPSYIERAEANGPYLNFFYRRSYLVQSAASKFLASNNKKSGHPARSEVIIVEYSSVNIAKPFHIGHLRTTLIGSSLDRIYRHLGYKVIGINHLGDWGTQFGFVWAGCRLWGKPDNASIFDLVDLYIRASNLRRAQDEGKVDPADADKPNVNQIARDYFIRLEAKEPEAREFWQWCLDISLKYLSQLYARLGVKFDHITGESFYEDKLPQVERMLRESGALEESRGALGVQLDKKLGFVRIFAEDGRSLYITRDIATADYRFHTFNPSKILYVVGAPQSLHFQQLKAVLARIKHPAADLIEHVAYGNVPGISTRSASKEDRIWLHSLLDEAQELALAAYRSQVEKKPAGIEEGSEEEKEVAEKVGLGAIVFNYMCRTNTKEFHFSWEEALNFQGDTGPYIQYAIARINSIEEKAKQAGICAPAMPNYDLLTDDPSRNLALLLARFDESIAASAREREPYHIALITLDTARAFSSAYAGMRVIGAEPQVAGARLALFMAVRNALKLGLSLLGVPTIERM